MRPLVILAADDQCRATLRGFFERHNHHLSLGCGAISVDGVAFNPDSDIFVHPNSDPGVWKDADKDMILSAARNLYEKALIILDAAFEGAPSSDKIVADIEALVEMRAGWSRDRFEVIVIEPELEAWIWQRSVHVVEAFDFPGTHNQLWDLLANRAIALEQRSKSHRFVDVSDPAVAAWPTARSKPENPKGVVEALRAHCQSGPASGIFNEITSRVSVNGCVDTSFHKMREALRRWFPAVEAAAQ